MQLESWEIELRKQLEEKLVKKEEVLPKETIIFQPKKDNSFLIFLTLFLFLAIGLAYYHKKSKIEVPSKDYGEEIVLIQQQIDRLGLEKNEQLEKILSKLKTNNEKIALLGALNNENFFIIKNNHDKNHIIFFNSDWTLNQSPHYLDLTPEEKEFFEKWTKPKN